MSEAKPRLSKPCPHPSRTNGRHELYTRDNHLHCRACGAVSKLMCDELMERVMSDGAEKESAK